MPLVTCTMQSNPRKIQPGKTLPTFKMTLGFGCGFLDPGKFFAVRSGFSNSPDLVSGKLDKLRGVRVEFNFSEAVRLLSS